MDMPERQPEPPKPESVRLQLRHATFEQLRAVGHDVTYIEDGAAPLEFDGSIPHEIPKNWKRPSPVIVPKIVAVNDASLFGDGSAMLPDGLYCYFDSVFTNRGWRAQREHTVKESIDPETDEVTISCPGNILPVSGRCFSAISNYAVNFGHFIHDVLSRIYYEDLGVIAPGREKVIAPHLRYPMQKILFEMVFEGYDIIYAPRQRTLKVEELLLPANLCRSWEFNPAGIATLSKRICRALAPCRGTERHKICVSRSDGRKRESLGRNFVNEETYEARMQEIGYQVVEVSALDPQAQFSLWANTAEMVGIHGAGMMNMVMMPQESESVYTEIAGGGRSPEDNFKPVCLQTARCAMAVGHRTNLLASALDHQSRPIIDLNRLESVLHKNRNRENP